MGGMGEVVIRAEGLGKRYRIGRHEAPYKTLRESLSGLAMAPVRRLEALARGRPLRREKETIWALKDVNLDVRQGEVLGVIGRNGAGKSTLLKILSRITEPTEGRVVLNGRVGSLLEVGTGFHPELTGRENIYLNGAILGMRKTEIDRRFDEIVDFAEIDRFLDTPVKRYSSGMYVRLAFAVAAHMESEILLIDEVLAVGDAEFQKKCLSKMKDVATKQRTVIFVSHNMAAVEQLCHRSILLQHGMLEFDASSKDVIDRYLTEPGEKTVQLGAGSHSFSDENGSDQQNRRILRAVRLLDADGNSRENFVIGKPLTIEIDVEGVSAIPGAWIGVIFHSSLGHTIASINTGMTKTRVAQPRSAPETARLKIPRLPFTPGSYWISVSITRGLLGRVDYCDRAVKFQVESGDVYGTGYALSGENGLVFLDGSWEIVPACGGTTIAP